MEQFTPHIIPLDFRSRNMHNKNNKLETIYNKNFTNNIKIQTSKDIRKELGNTYNMMLNDEQDITSGYMNKTDILNNYINRPYVNPGYLFADYVNQNIKYNIYNSTINKSNNVTGIENSAIFHKNPVKLVDKPHKYIFGESIQSNYMDYNFINKVF